MNTPPLDPPVHPAEVRRVHKRLMAEADLSGSMLRTSDGAAVHVIEKGTGPPVVLIHGSGSPGLFWLPLLDLLDGVRAIVVDRPGFGLSDPVPASATLTQTAVGWIDRLLDALELPTAVLVGHSMGGLWSMRFALEHPERVSGLVMIGTPTLPGTRAPLPFRLMGTPGLGAAVAAQRATPKSVNQFATMVGEGDSVGAYPHLVELMVAAGNDPVAARATRQEVTAIISPWAIASRTGFRGKAQVSEAELLGLTVPTLLVQGDHDPVGGGDVARELQTLIPHAELTVVDGGHAPWLGKPSEVATAILDWVHR